MIVISIVRIEWPLKSYEKWYRSSRGEKAGVPRGNADMPPLPFSGAQCLLESLAGKVGENERRAVDLLVVILAQLLLFFGRPAANRLLEVGVGILGANHESDLARGIGGNGGVGVFHGREDFFAVFLELGNEWQMEPLVLG